MDSLPNELLTLIFNCLDFENLVNSIRRVCRNWLILVDKLVKFRSIIINEESEPFILKLFQTGQLVDYENALVVGSSRYLNRPSLEAIWKNIRKLVVYNCDVDYNCFDELEHLETMKSENKVIDLKRVPKLVTINLKKLKILNLQLKLSVHTYYVLDTPVLHSLKAATVENFELRFPLQLINLECAVYNERIKAFSNLRTLICTRIDIYNGKLFQNLRKLEQFQVNCIDKLDLNELLREKEELKLDRLKIIVKGIIIDGKDYPIVLLNNDFEIFSTTNQQLFLDNYDKLASKLHFISTFFVDFDIASLPDGLYSKISNLRSIVVHFQLEDELSWSSLLKSSQMINTIKICHPIGQYYCDLIARYCAYLNTLFIQKANVGRFEFVSKFKNLERFITDQELSIDEFKAIVQVLDRNRFLKFIQFKFKRIDFKVEVLDGEVYMEYYKCIKIQTLDRFVQTLQSINSWPDIIVQMENISNFRKDEFKFKNFRLCWRFRRLGTCDSSPIKIIQGFDPL